MPPPRTLLAAIRFPAAGDDASDTELLGRFAADRDEAAFDALVRRHARLVWGVCRRTLGPGPDAEDAFQATFLVLARRPDRARRFGTAAGFLFGVARRVALKAKCRAARPGPRRAAQVPPADPAATAAFREIQTILDEEIGRLPDRYRLPFVLCVLEGKPRARAAADLGLNPGTLSARLARARLRLRDRLTGRGVSLAAALAATDLAADAAPPELTAAAVAAATRAGGVGANVLFLASEGWWAVGKAKLLAAGVVVAGVGGVVGLADGPAVPPAAKAEPPKPAAEAGVGVGAAEPAKPAGPGRAKLLFAAPLFGQTKQPVWSRDGKVVVAPAGDTLAVIRPFDGGFGLGYLGQPPSQAVGKDHGSKSAFTKPGEVLGFSADLETLFTRLDADGRVNAENYVLAWNGGGNSYPEPKARPVYDPDDGTPVAIFPDGKRILCQSARGLTELDLTTGQLGRVVVATADLGALAFTPDLRLVASLQKRDGPVVSVDKRKADEEIADIGVWDLTTGKRKWSRVIKNY